MQATLGRPPRRAHTSGLVDRLLDALPSPGHLYTEREVLAHMVPAKSKTDAERDQALLHPVMKAALEPLSLAVAGYHDPRARAPKREQGVSLCRVELGVSSVINATAPAGCRSSDSSERWASWTLAIARRSSRATSITVRLEDADSGMVKRVAVGVRPVLVGSPVARRDLRAAAQHLLELMQRRPK